MRSIASVVRMLPLALLVTTGCDVPPLELEPVASAEAALNSPLPDCDDLLGTGGDLCGWRNGWQGGWSNGFHSFVPGPDRPDGWTNLWTPDWVDQRYKDDMRDATYQLGSMSSWSVAFSMAWGDELATDWDFVAAPDETDAAVLADKPRWQWAEMVRWLDRRLARPFCEHPTSIVGEPLDARCSPVVGRVCAEDPSCCATAWSDSCAASATALASEGTASERILQHSSLPIPAAENACAAAVCATSGHASCCAADGAWTGKCAVQATQVCTSRYLANPRVEPGDASTPDDDRVMVDACVEAEIPGAGACPVMTDGRACCRSMLVLRGVYAAHVPTGRGRQVSWEPLERAGAPVHEDVVATLVEKPCDLRPNGVTECRPETMHKLWQLAGPTGPMYPDCTNARGPRPCDTTCPVRGGTCVADPGHDRIGHRALLATVSSALLTTNGRWEVGFGWSWGARTGAPLSNPHGLVAHEADWTVQQSPSGRLLAMPYCYTTQALQRRGPNANVNLINGVRLCSVGTDPAAPKSIRTLFGRVIPL